MRLIKFSTLFLVALFFTISLHGQTNAPGYLGKRITASYSGFLNLNLQNSNEEVSFENFSSPYSEEEFYKRPENADRDLGFNYHHVLNFEWVTGKNFALRAGFISSANYFGRNLNLPTGSGINPTVGEDNLQYSMRLNEWGRYRANGLNLGFRWYTKHHAPLGFFFELNMGYDWISYGEVNVVRPPNYSATGIPRDDLPENFSVPEGSMTAPNLGMAWGYQRVIKDQWVIGFTSSINVVLGHSFGNRSNSLVKGSSDNIENLENTALFRYTQQRIVNFGFSIGYLL